MKKILLLLILIEPLLIQAQNYPEPEFSKEVYYLKKDSVQKVIRLEKQNSKIESKIKLAGMGGSESAYILESANSTVRFSGANNISFVFSTGAASGSSSNSQRDSMMRANGMDPSMMDGLSGMNGANDPASTIALFKLETTASNRKVIIQKNPGMSPFGSKKQRSSTKYSFSVKKIREGYWELVIDKTLPKGEYAFTMQGMEMGNIDNSVTLFAFGIN
jgi:hypothetical protein